MSFDVKNLTANAVAVGKLTIPANETRTVDFVDAAIVAGVNGGYLSITGQTATSVAGANVALTDNSGGTASTTLAVIADAPTANAIASLAAAVNQLIVQVNNGNALSASLDQRVNN